MARFGARMKIAQAPALVAPQAELQAAGRQSLAATRIELQWCRSTPGYAVSFKDRAATMDTVVRATVTPYRCGRKASRF